MNLRQAVETLAMPKGRQLTRPCPSCKQGKLTLVEATIVEPMASGYHVIGTALPQRERECLAAACNACEFMTEVRI